MNVIDTTITDVKIIEPRVFGDARGFFYESFNQKAFTQAIGADVTFVQDNHSKSGLGVLRGLHYQIQQPQAKLVRVVSGKVFDVVVDIRRSSPTFGQWAGVELSAENHRQLYVPEGFAHGFCVLSETALLSYLCTRLYVPEFDAAIAWNDPDIAVEWPYPASTLSDKDAKAPMLADIPRDQLPGMNH